MNRKRKANLRILFCGNDAENLSLIQTYLVQQLNREFTLIRACCQNEVEVAFVQKNVDLVLMDIDVKNKSNMYRMSQIIENHLVPVIVLTEHGDEETAVQSLKQGVIDYIPKSTLSSTRLVQAIDQAISKWKTAQCNIARQEELERQANIDSLTGLLNRRVTLRLLKESMRRARRYEEKLCVILLDIDEFKQINDLHGHKAGDSTLRKVAVLMQKRLRDTDVVGRYGGDEFLIILPHTNRAGALLPAERIRKGIEMLNMKDRKGNTFCVTASFGIAEYKVGDDSTSIIQRADNLLYEAKQIGRNRILK
jgi:diguanylate cyclase (GGDEF)-like protein